jgi:hypothetical protein
MERMMECNRTSVSLVEPATYRIEHDIVLKQCHWQLVCLQEFIDSMKTDSTRTAARRLSRH